MGKLLKLILIAGLIFGGVWVYGWYQGKVAPSIADTVQVSEGERVGYFAGGCFWCTESDFEKLIGVTDVVSGYMGGDIPNPTYQEVVRGGTGYREMVKVTYDPSQVSYRRLVLELLRETDPTDLTGSFYDRGYQYSSAIYYQTEEEREIAEGVIAELEERNVFEKPIVTAVELASTFWVAEDYHQDYYKKNPIPYKHYRKGSGRDLFIESVWGSGEFDDLFVGNIKKEGLEHPEEYQKPSDEVLKRILTPIQYKVTQKDGTEKPFDNEYWDNKEAGIYVDVVSGEPLFSSTDKYDSGTGWPSFLKPLDYDFVTERDDYKLIVKRIEVRSKYADSHLGHILMDGPASNNFVRYCINSAALRFVPVADLASEGLEDYLPLFS